VAPGEVGFENHLNYYHCNGRGLDYDLAKGLTAFLNSTLLDEYFRQFNGHTQVNATDLRSLPYPSREQLEALGAKIGEAFPSQDELDRLIEEELLRMPEDLEIPNPVEAKKKIGDKLCIIGNVPTSLIMTGTPQQVKEHCRKLIEVCGKGGGYVLAAGANIDEGNPDNLRAMTAAAKEYGVYQ
jgi:hypothetical protein